ncbi:MAG: ABC transporter substrate-binding protein [Desulfobacterales bacterium]|nr:ABC transporter substrate-binding protein [Desulfobacterales bacterium]MCP4161832.1 ABC transporter substrate-binding protein [Deltaproteobacteria bacterium]
MKENYMITQNGFYIRFGIYLLLIILFQILFMSCSQQKEEKKISIGISHWVSNPEFGNNLQGFKEGLAEKGYIEGKNIEFVIRNPKADKEKQHEIINEFIELKVDLIYSLTTPGTLIAKSLTNKIPIVFSIVTYPVEAGVIESLTRSNNNLVGTRNYIQPSRQFLLFRKISPDVKTIAIVHRKGEPNSTIQYNEFKKLLNANDIDVIDIAGTDKADIHNQLELNKEKIDAVYSTNDTLIQSGGEEVVIAFCNKNNKISFSGNKDGVLKGALAGNVADFYTIGKMSGTKAGLILNGAMPSSLLTESPVEDYIIINTKTSEKIDLKISQLILKDAKKIVRK